MSGRKTLPILDCILLGGEDELLSVSATDLETTLVVHSVKDAVIDGHGTACLPYKLLSDILKKMKDTEITVSIENLRVSVVHASGRFDFVSVDPKDYPNIDVSHKLDRKIEYESQLFVNAISRALLFASKDNYRPMLSGVFVDVSDNGETNIVGTDAMALASIQLNKEHGGSDLAMSGIIPLKGVAALRASLKKDDSNVEFGFTDRFAIVRDEFVSVSIRLLEQKYPNYRSVIPAIPSVYSVIDKTKVADSLSRVLAFSAETNMIKLYLSNGQIEITTSDVDAGRMASDKVEVDYSGEEFFIRANGDMLLNAIQSFNDVELELAVIHETKPLMIMGSDATCLVMPSMPSPV